MAAVSDRTHVGVRTERGWFPVALSTFDLALSTHYSLPSP